MRFEINGRKVSKEEYIYSTEDGVHRGYWENGEVWYEDNYQNGQRHGVQRGYYNNGELAYERLYHNGKKVPVDNKLSRQVLFGKVDL